MSDRNDPNRTFSVDEEWGPRWKHPASPLQVLLMFQKIRDSFLTKTLAGLQLTEARRFLSVDEESCLRPLQLHWDMETCRTLSWSENLGVVGAGLIVKHRVPESVDRFVGMIQIGGIIVGQQEYEQIPNGRYIQAKQSRITKDWTLLTHLSWFTSAYGLALIDERSPGAREQMWHNIPEKKWEQILQRFVETCGEIK